MKNIKVFSALFFSITLFSEWVLQPIFCSDPFFPDVSFSKYKRLRRQLFRGDIPHHRPLSGNVYALHHGFPHPGRWHDGPQIVAPQIPGPIHGVHNDNNLHDDFGSNIHIVDPPTQVHIHNEVTHDFGSPENHNDGGFGFGGHGHGNSHEHGHGHGHGHQQEHGHGHGPGHGQGPGFGHGFGHGHGFGNGHGFGQFGHGYNRGHGHKVRVHHHQSHSHHGPTGGDHKTVVHIHPVEYGNFLNLDDHSFSGPAAPSPALSYGYGTPNIGVGPLPVEDENISHDDGKFGQKIPETTFHQHGHGHGDISPPSHNDDGPIHTEPEYGPPPPTHNNEIESYGPPPKPVYGPPEEPSHAGPHHHGPPPRGHLPSGPAVYGPPRAGPHRPSHGFPSRPTHGHGHSVSVSYQNHPVAHKPQFGIPIPVPVLAHFHHSRPAHSPPKHHRVKFPYAVHGHKPRRRPFFSSHHYQRPRKSKWTVNYGS